MSTEQLSEPKPTPTQTASDEINKTLHVKFMHYMYHVLPEPYSSQDCNRLTLMYFVIGGLDLLGELDKYDKKNIIEFVYNLQVHPDKDDFGMFASSYAHGSFCLPRVRVRVRVALEQRRTLQMLVFVVATTLATLTTQTLYVPTLLVSRGATITRTHARTTTTPFLTHT